MKYTPYWLDTAPRFTAARAGPVEGRHDVAVIGAGFTGIAAARALALRGASVVVLEAQHVGFGASARNGGHLNAGFSQPYPAMEARLGAARAAALYRFYGAGVDRIEALIAEEGIACDFRRAGRLSLASKPGHVPALEAAARALAAGVDPGARVLEPAEVAAETGSPLFYGALLQPGGAMMHMGKYGAGLAMAAVRHGAVIHESAPVETVSPGPGGHRLVTPRGVIEAREVLVATNGYTAGRFGWIGRRILPVGSYVLATRPLTPEELARTLPADRTCVTSLQLGTYFRLSPDRRLIFGGRAKFSRQGDASADPEAGRILRRALVRTFPHLSGIDIDYCWGGLTGVTRDRLPRLGVHDGIHYAMGYSGQGAQLATLLGETIATRISGGAAPVPLDGLDWRALPFASGRRWTLPLVGGWSRFRDSLG